MKYLILLEGNTEKAFIELLMDRGLFKINADDMLDLRPHQKRQLDTYLLAMIRQLDKDEKVIIMRIGDKLTDNLRIPKDIKEKIHLEEKYCTKPEFEMLIIIAEGLYDEYQKVKSTIKPKVFARQRVMISGMRYDNSQVWIKKYFEEFDVEKLLKKYRSMAHHSLEELFLCELIK